MEKKGGRHPPLPLLISLAIHSPRKPPMRFTINAPFLAPVVQLRCPEIVVKKGFTDQRRV